MITQAVVIDAYFFDANGQTTSNIERILAQTNLIIIRYAETQSLNHKPRAKAAVHALQRKFSHFCILLCSTANDFNHKFQKIRTQYGLNDNGKILYISGIEEIAKYTKNQGFGVELQTNEYVQKEIDAMRQVANRH